MKLSTSFHAIRHSRAMHALTQPLKFWPSILLGLVVLVLAAVRVHSSATSELAAARRAEAAGDLDQAVTRYGRSIRWYVPGWNTVLPAASQLSALANAAEERGDVALAIRIHRELRGALYGARWLWLPEFERVQRANERISTLSAGDDLELRIQLRDRLDRDARPDSGPALLAVGGFLAFILYGFALARSAGKIAPRRKKMIARAILTVLSGVAFLSGLVLCDARPLRPHATWTPIIVAIALATLTGVLLVLSRTLRQPRLRIGCGIATLAVLVVTLLVTISAVRPGFF